MQGFRFLPPKSKYSGNLNPDGGWCTVYDFHDFYQVELKMAWSDIIAQNSIPNKRYYFYILLKVFIT
jgi:hypothetical protein